MRPTVKYRDIFKRAVLCIAFELFASRVNAIEIKATSNARPEIVFRWATDRCSKEMIPDAAVRAFRRKSGEVVVYAPHDSNYPLVGKDVATVKPDCDASFKAMGDNNPEHYNAKIWLQSFYTEDGTTIFSLGSSDYHGYWFDRCKMPTDRNKKCWWSAITLATSKNEGRTFEMMPAPNHVVARAPHRYSENAAPPPGFFTASNILKKDGYYYALIFAFGYAEQPRGNCLMRTTDLSDARSWRFLKGGEFSGQFVDPNFPQTEDPNRYRCDVVAGITEPIRSVLHHSVSNQFVATFSHPERDGSVARVDFQYSTSPDLRQWSKPKTIVSFNSDPSCEKALLPVGYPSMLDENSKDLNFNTIGADGYIYFTRFNSAPSCKGNYDRDLLRLKITLQ